LDYAHSQNIIHRDVKPSNILLTQRGQPMLSDFGIAKILESEETATLTGTGIGVGTPEYMAPEQWTGQAGPQSDIYSLGVVLYELVTGRKPYSADTPAAILLKQANDPLPRPGQFAPDLPEAVEKVLLKALAKDPVNRYGKMGEFTYALEELLKGSLPEQIEGLDTKPGFLGRESKLESKPSALPRWSIWIPIISIVALLGIGIPIGIKLINEGKQVQSLPIGLATLPSTRQPEPDPSLFSPISAQTQLPASIEALSTVATSVSLPTPTGKLLWSDNFDDGFSHGFSFWTGDWKVVDDGTGNKVLQMNSPVTCCANAAFGPANLPDGIVEFRLKVVNPNNQAQGYFGFRDQSSINGQWTHYFLVYDQNGPDLSMTYQENGGLWQPLEGISGGGLVFSQEGGWITLHIEFQGKNIRVFVDGNLFMIAEDSRDEDGGLILGAIGPAIAQFDDFKVWDFGTK